ncbi:MAG: ABC transporter permease subunit [Chlamydiales bacterium]
MWNYTLRRLLLLPITLFFIVLVNFAIINLAPGEPTSYVEVSAQGAMRQADRSFAFGGDERYLQFREFYGLTLPILLNSWPFLSPHYALETLWKLDSHRYAPDSPQEMPTKEYNQLRTLFGDQSRFLMPDLLALINDPQTPPAIKRSAAQFFVRGAMRLGYVGPSLTKEQKKWNEQVTSNDLILRSLTWTEAAPPAEIQEKIRKMNQWYHENLVAYQLDPGFSEKIGTLFFQTRFVKYMSRVVRLDFGTLRNDSNKTVISEVVKRFKYSLTLSIIPMLLTLVFCQIFGFLMALYHGMWPDLSLNLIFLALYAVPVFVVAPFLIENVALNHCFPFIHTPIPISGFTSPDRIYDQELSSQKLFDILQHIALPILAVMYGSLAAQSRISRTAILEVLRQDYVRTAWAKGLPRFSIYFKHVGRNAAITIVSSIAGSLGLVLGGSLIVEILFDINGFGKFFYDGVINRDYNVIMFSALAGSFLTLIGYLVADLAYMWLDPRITLD